MTATATETDILAALDYDEERECEHPHHHTHVAHDTGPATYWAITTHACYGPVGIPYPVCSAYAAEWASPTAVTTPSAGATRDRWTLSASRAARSAFAFASAVCA